MTDPSEALTQLAERLAERLKDSKQSVAVAESSSGGLISAALLAVPGASAYYMGGTVIYTLQARRAFLGASDEEMRAQRPVTDGLVTLFARRARELVSATWGVAELGVAGPTGSPYGHPPGVSVVGVDGPRTRSRQVETGDDDRAANMQRFAVAGLELLLATLDEAD